MVDNSYILDIKLKCRECLSKHYKTPKKFHKLDLEKVIIKLPKNDIDKFKIFIDKVKELNTCDPGFCYTCESTDTYFIWYLGYTDINILDSVYNIGETIFNTHPINLEFITGGIPAICPLKAW